MGKEIILASRIGSIQRFTGKPSSDFINRYQTLFQQYAIDIEQLKSVINGDNSCIKEHELLVRAGKIAEAEIDQEGRKTDGNHLSSVFSRLSLTDDTPDRTRFMKYNLKELKPENTFPTEIPDDSEDEKLRNNFYTEMDKLRDDSPADFENLMICLDRIFMKYMWCLSASDHEGEDISLYDNMRVTEAVIRCLTYNPESQEPFAMVVGDFSGIQKYIFGISSANNKNVSKRLRARSFYVDVISKIFAQYIVDTFQVSRANILLQTGGKFYCLVPAVSDIDEKLVKIREEMDQHLFKQFHGSVCINLAWNTFGDEGLTHYSDTITELNRLLSEKKTTPFRRILADDNGWNEAAFILQNDLKGKHVCPNCGTELIPVGKDSCPVCDMQIEIGKKVPKTKYLLYVKRNHNTDKSYYPLFKDYYIYLSGDTDKISEMEECYLIEALNNNDADLPAHLPFIYKYMVNYAPLDKEGVLPFDEIAEHSKGMNKLGILKADVDVLGFLFSQGLRTGKRHYGTVSRVNTMSRMLEVFFCGYVQQLLKNNDKYRYVYSVYSGGDDLFLLGPWDIMIDLAIDIHERFKAFTADNKDITLSAGISVFGNREHISFMAEESEHQLERAKNETLPQIYPGKKGRNAVCVIKQIFSWEDLEEQMKNTDTLVRLISSKTIDVNVLRRVMKYSDMYRQFLVDGDVWKLMFEPLFYYDRKRNYKKTQHDSEDKKWFDEEYIFSMNNASDTKNISKSLFFAETVITIALNKTRKERNTYGLQ